MESSTPIIANSHDLLALGEISAALSQQQQQQQDHNLCEIKSHSHSFSSRNLTEQQNDDWQGSVLSYLTRLLNHASIATTTSTSTSTSTSKADNGKSKSSNDSDDNARILECVEKLEDAAASHTQGDMVDDIVSAVEAVMASGKKTNFRLNKLLQTPLQRRVNRIYSPELNGSDVWDTSPLEDILYEIRKIMGIVDNEMKKGGSPTASIKMDDVNINEISTDELGTKRKYTEVTSEESGDECEDEVWEDIVRKTLHDLIELLVASLQAAKDKSSRHDTDGVVPSQILHLKADSPLSIIDETNSSMLFILPQILHYAPVLRHRHVACALCRAQVPNAALLAKGMAANCPVAVSSIVVGCLDAYVNLRKSFDSSSAEVNVCKYSIKAISTLSQHESEKVVDILIERQLLPSVLLDILFRSNPTLASHIILGDILQHIKKLKTEMDLNTTTYVYRSQEVFDDRYISKRLNTIDNQKSCCSWIAGELLTDSSLAIRTLSGLIESFFSTQDTFAVQNINIALRVVCLIIVHHSHLTALPSKAWGSVIEKVIKCMEAYITSDSIVDDNDSKCSFVFIISICFVLFCLDNITTELIVRFVVDSLLPRTHTIAKHEDIAFILGSILQNKGETFEEVLQQYVGNLSTSIRECCREKFPQFSHVIVDRAGKDMLKSICQKVVVIETFISNPKAFLCGASGIEMSESDVCDIFRRLFNDSDMCMRLVKSSTLEYALETAIDLTLRYKEPVLYSNELICINESLWSSTNMTSTATWNSPHAKFLIHLYYWIALSDADNKFPFLIDLRNISLEEAIICCNQCLSIESSTENFFSSLKRKIQGMFPETMHCNPPSIAYHYVKSECTNRLELKQISSSIKDAVESEGDPILSHNAVVLYYAAKKDTNISTRLLDLKAAQALLSSGKSLPVYFTYSSLCHDPLAMLKCDLVIWKSELRLIILSILKKILLINEFILRSTDKGAFSSIFCRQLLITRDIVVVRCLLTLLSDVFLTKSTRVSRAMFCYPTVKLIRSIVGQRRGIVAVLLRERLQDDCLTLLVQLVPEAIFDADILTNVLLDKSTPIVSRLCIADATLRMVIKNSSFDEEKSNKLAFTSLTVMINSFYLAQGPAGMAADVLYEKESGTDICHLCRIAILQMIEAMETIKGNREHLKNECAMALGKLASLCKAEFSEGKRTTTILQTMWEATNRASIALGSSRCNYNPSVARVDPFRTRF